MRFSLICSFSCLLLLGVSADSSVGGKGDVSVNQKYDYSKIRKSKITTTSPVVVSADGNINLDVTAMNDKNALGKRLRKKRVGQRIINENNSGFAGKNASMLE